MSKCQIRGDIGDLLHIGGAIWPGPQLLHLTYVHEPHAMWQMHHLHLKMTVGDMSHMGQAKTVTSLKLVYLVAGLIIRKNVTH